MPDSQPILLVDDDWVDVMIVKRALRDLGVTAEVAYASGGEEALAYLAEKNHPTPCVILLDLNMPRMDGLELLMALKADKATKDIPVVVVTTSGDKRDIAESLRQGAVGYVVKCPDYAAFRETLGAFEPYLVCAQAAGLYDDLS
jgi:CheY-like chemotaxis protein